MKGFKPLLLGAVAAKSFGLIREIVFFNTLGYDTSFSEVLSLLAFTSLIAVFADTSLLNPVLFPTWDKVKKPTIHINPVKSLLTLFLVSIIIFSLNLQFIQNSQSLLVLFLTSILWIPLIAQGVLYSVLLYTGSYKQFSISISSISLSFLLFFLIFKNCGSTGYLYSRSLSIIYGVAVLWIFSRSKINMKLEKAQLKNYTASIVNFLNTNNVIWFLILVKLYFAFFETKQMTVLNYSLVIVLTFYTLVGKNLNALYLRKTILKTETSNGYFKRYVVLGGIFIFLISLTLLFKKTALNFLPSSVDEEMFLLTIDHNIILALPLLVLGFLDLINQSRVNNNPKYNKINLAIIMISLIVYYKLLQYLFHAGKTFLGAT